MKRYWCAKIVFPLPNNFSGSNFEAASLWMDQYRQAIEELQTKEKKQPIKMSRFERWLNARGFDRAIRRVRKGISEKGEMIYAARPIKENGEDYIWRY